MNLFLPPRRVTWIPLSERWRIIEGVLVVKQYYVFHATESEKREYQMKWSNVPIIQSPTEIQYQRPPKPDADQC